MSTKCFGLRASGFGLRASRSSVCLNQNTVSPSRATRKGRFFLSQSILKKAFSFLDHMMPEIDGIEALGLRHLREFG